MKNIGRFLAVFVLFSIPAFAQNRDFTIFAGGTFPGSVNLADVENGVTQTLTDPINAGLLGIRYGRGRVLGHEETLAYTNKFLDDHSKAILLNGNLMVHVPLPYVRPYGTFGMGTVISWGSGPSDIGNRFAVNYGGGIKILPGGPVGIRIDARGYSVFSVQNQLLNQSQTLNIGEVTVGVLFAF
jgi:hypothetical protein